MRAFRKGIWLGEGLSEEVKLELLSEGQMDN